ncbi:hypothetical protein VOLCADRAFT_108540 [Volvox carteri f. nagariensis]|uniref:Uncharacterized protein n=1 Tax=Volvox carteri f. nagariensis TaxID=3068 RepID=D8UKT2_VOLCA|nr:uncharacterized protein VOLCADRAFT_108540 [Volvox carteri f. nagariensis]EFJ39666.1 hypothetical protein VOLCADRAFT_108540 [Volvox carteri f. nagariensis]|eukprot:XP_002959267.1 hypothetical protein VOLCADRAFT_108540 [Volvox carteri f. nagariensis]
MQETRGMEAVRGAGRPKKSRHAQAQTTEVPGRAARLPGPVKVTLLKRKARPWERRKIDRELPEQSVSSSSGESASSSDEDRQPGRTTRARRAASEDIRQARAEGSSAAGRQAERDIQSESRGQVGQQVDWRALGKTLAAKHGDKATSLRGTLESNAASDPGAIVALRIEEFLGSEDGRQLFVGRRKELMAIGLADALEQFVLASRAGSLRWIHESLEARLRRGLTPLIEEIADLLAAAFRTAAGTYPGASPDFGRKCTVPQLMTTACQKASDAARVPDVQEWSQRMAEALCAPGWGAAVVEECEKIQPQLPVEGIPLWRVFLAALRSKFSCSDTGAQFSAQELRQGLFPAAVSLVRLTIAAKAALAETELIAVDKRRDGAREQYTRPRYTPSLPGGEGPQSFGGVYRVPSGTQWAEGPRGAPAGDMYGGRPVFNTWGEPGCSPAPYPPQGEAPSYATAWRGTQAADNRVRGPQGPTGWVPPAPSGLASTAAGPVPRGFPPPAPPPFRDSRTREGDRPRATQRPLNWDPLKARLQAVQPGSQRTDAELRKVTQENKLCFHYAAAGFTPGACPLLAEGRECRWRHTPPEGVADTITLFVQPARGAPGGGPSMVGIQREDSDGAKEMETERVEWWAADIVDLSTDPLARMEAVQLLKGSRKARDNPFHSTGAGTPVSPQTPRVPGEPPFHQIRNNGHRIAALRDPLTLVHLVDGEQGGRERRPH